MTNRTKTDRTARAISRSEAKAITRSRLVDAALYILDEEGEAALTTMNVTSRAGIAQSSFYVHFTCIDDLLHELIQTLSTERRRLTRAARNEARSGRLEPLRDSFRIPITHFVAHPRLFRLLVKSQYDLHSPLGEWSRQEMAESRRALVEDLHAAGLPLATDADHRRAELIADAINAMTHVMVLGHLDARYPDIEEMIDVLVVFSKGYFRLLEPARPSAGDT